MLSKQQPTSTEVIDAKLATSASPMKLNAQVIPHLYGTFVELPGNLLISMRNPNDKLFLLGTHCYRMDDLLSLVETIHARDSGEKPLHTLKRKHG